MKNLILILLNLLAIEAVAQNYTCYNSRSETHVAVSGDVATIESLAGEKVSLRLGEATKIGERNACTKWAARGISCPILGTGDPYEMCRTQCVQSGKETETTTVKLSDDKLFITIHRETRTVVDRMILSDKEFSGSSKQECIREDFTELLETRRGGYTESLTLNTSEGIVKAYGHRIGDHFLEVEYETVNMETNRVGQALQKGKMTSKSLIQALASASITLIDLEKLSVSYHFAAGKVTKAYCVGETLYHQFELSVEGTVAKITSLDNERLPTYEPTLGTIQVIDGKTMMIVKREISPVLSVAPNYFFVDGAVCRVSQ